MTTKFELITTTSRENNKWVHTVGIFEKNHKSHEYTCENNNEIIITHQVINEFIFFYPEMEFLLTKFKTSLSEDRQKFLKANEPVFTTVEESEVNSELLLKHISCLKKYKKEKGPFTRNYAKKNGIHSISVKDMLKKIEENSPSTGFFTRNSCPVCMASYKEVVEEDHHIVIPACGHPICCKCCDELLCNDGRCSICRNDYDFEEFDIMVFDINLQQIPNNRNVFC